MEMIWPWVSYPPANQSGFTINLVMLSRFSRAARRQSPKWLLAPLDLLHVSYLLLSCWTKQVTWLSPPLLWEWLGQELSQQGNWELYLINLGSMKYKRLQNEAREFLLGICTPGLEQTKSRWALKIRDPGEKMAALHYQECCLCGGHTEGCFTELFSGCGKAWVKCSTKNKWK